jgi:hypothetical protein
VLTLSVCVRTNNKQKKYIKNFFAWLALFYTFFFLVKNTLYRFYYNLETGPARRVDLGLELSRVEEKIEERKTR